MSLLKYIRPLISPIDHAPNFEFAGLGHACGSSFIDALESAHDNYKNEVWQVFYDDNYSLKDYINDGEEVLDPDTHECDELYENNCECEKKGTYLKADNVDKLAVAHENSLYECLNETLQRWAEQLYDDLDVLPMNEFKPFGKGVDKTDNDILTC